MNLALGMCNLLGEAGAFDEILNSFQRCWKNNGLGEKKEKTMDLEGCIFKWSVGFVGKVNWTMVILMIFKSRFNQEREYQTRKDIFPSFF